MQGHRVQHRGTVSVPPRRLQGSEKARAREKISESPLIHSIGGDLLFAGLLRISKLSNANREHSMSSLAGARPPPPQADLEPTLERSRLPASQPMPKIGGNVSKTMSPNTACPFADADAVNPSVLSMRSS